MSKKEKILIVIGIIFISFNLRAPITAVGSVVDLIQLEYGLSNTVAGFITTLPLIAFAIVSPFVAKISRKLGFGKTMAIGLVLMAIGEVVRSYTNAVGLFIGTALMGVGIAIGNVLIPSIIKTKFDNKVGLMTSIYTSGMCIYAAVGAGISVPLATGLDLGWSHSLASWLILTLITLVLWLPQMKNKDSKQSAINVSINTEIDESKSVWKQPIAWWVTLFMGTQSLIFYSLVAWLPGVVMSKAMTASFAGNMAMTFQLMAIPATLLIPYLCDKFKDQRMLVLATCIVYIVGIGTLIFATSTVAIVFAIVFMGFGMGGSISLSIAFISLRSPIGGKASELSGMSQSAGYLIAAVGPILLGKVFDILQVWNVPMMILCGLITALAVFGWFAGRNKTII